MTHEQPTCMFCGFKPYPVKGEKCECDKFGEPDCPCTAIFVKHHKDVHKKDLGW